MTLTIYQETRDFPRDEWYGLRAQMRRAAVSIAANIVEGNARRGTLEYVNFLNTARGSAAELGYFVLLATELGYLPRDTAAILEHQSAAVIAQLEALVQRMETLAREERRKTKN